MRTGSRQWRWSITFAEMLWVSRVKLLFVVVVVHVAHSTIPASCWFGRNNDCREAWSVLACFVAGADAEAVAWLHLSSLRRYPAKRTFGHAGIWWWWRWRHHSNTAPLLQRHPFGNGFSVGCVWCMCWTKWWLGPDWCDVAIGSLFFIPSRSDKVPTQRAHTKIIRNWCLRRLCCSVGGGHNGNNDG